MALANPFDFTTGKTVGAMAKPVAPEGMINLGLVVRLERENYFATVLGVPGRQAGGSA